MSEQENKIPTAVEIEQALRERHQKEIEQNDKTDKGDEDDGKSVKRLGIEKLKKSRKGLVIIVAAFLLLAAGVSVYYIPSIIRAMSSGDDKPASNAVSTGSVKRATGLSDDVDPFNTREEPAKTEERKESSGKAETHRKKYNKTSVVRWMWPMGGAALLPQIPVVAHQRPAIPGTRGTAVTNRQRFSLLMQGNPRSFLKLRAFLMTLTFSFLKIPRLSARWTDDLFLIWLASWSVRLMRTYTVQTGM